MYHQEKSGRVCLPQNRRVLPRYQTRALIDR